MKRSPIYLDYNATAPCDPRVVESMLPYFNQRFGNTASADHRYGWQAKDAVEDARGQVAQLVGARAKRIVFTSGATESVNLALKGLAEAMQGRGDHIITCTTEHRAVLDTCAYLETKGFRVTYLDVDGQGRLSLEELEEAITRQTVCIAIMYANNETGVIHPINAIGTLARKHHVPFFCDATQAVGKVAVNVETDCIDFLALSAHKLYGPQGVGALFVGGQTRDMEIVPRQHGGHHEGGLRSGTLNVPGIVGLGQAAVLCQAELSEEGERLRNMRDRLEQTLAGQVPGIRVNGGGDRLPHVSNLLLPHGHAEQLLLGLAPYLAMSRGSACSGLVQRPSHVLKGMGLSDAEADRCIRISLGRFTRPEEVEEAAARIAQAIAALEPVEGK